MRKVAYFTVFVFTLSMGNAVTVSKCRGKLECKSLKDCAPFMSLLTSLEKPLKPAVVNFLRAQECGFEQGFPKVCCSQIPNRLKIFDSVTTESTVVHKTTAMSVPSFNIQVETGGPTATPIPYLKSNRIQEFNHAFRDFLDYDLFLRRTVRKTHYPIEIEIR